MKVESVDAERRRGARNCASRGLKGVPNKVIQ